VFSKIINYRWKRAGVIIAPTLAMLIAMVYAQHHTFDYAAYAWLAIPFLFVSVRRQSTVTVVCLVVLAAGLGYWRGSSFAQKVAAYDVVADQKVTLVGTVRTDAVYGQQYQLAFDLGEARVIESEEIPLVGTLSISGFGESAIYKGDRIKVTGKLRRSLGNNSARISYAQLEVFAHHDSRIDSVRRKFAAGLQSALPEPAASFGLGLLVGQRNTLPDDVSEQLKMVGLTHIIAVSGYNLMIMLRAANGLMSKRSKYQYLCLSLLLIIGFLLLAGSSPSIVRASVVCCLGLAAWYYGRAVQPIALLLVAAGVTALANPLYIWGNVSWYLSFLAFFGVLVLAPLITKRLYKTKKPKLVAAIVLESLCAEIMTLPYVLYIFGQMSTVGLLANLLVASMVPLAMLLALIAGLAGMIVPAFAGWLAWPATLLMTYMLDVARILSRLPHAYLEDIAFSVWLMIGSYVAVGFVMLTLAYRNRDNYAIITDKTMPP
jgi:competence protein ComEC